MVEAVLNKIDPTVSAYPDRNADVDLVEEPFYPGNDSSDTTCLERGTCDCFLCLFFQSDSTHPQALHSNLQHRGWRDEYMYGDGGREGAPEQSYQDGDQASQSGRPPPPAQDQSSPYGDYISGATYALQQRSLLGPFAMSNAIQSPMGHHSPPYGWPHNHPHGYHQQTMQQVPSMYISPYSQSFRDRPLSNPFYAQATAPSSSTFSPTSQSGSPNYSGTGSYMPYSLSISPSAYSLPSFPTSPQYSTHQRMNYPQHFAETEGQGTWWYLPPSSQYDPNPARYQGPFAVDYSHRQNESPQLQPQILSPPTSSHASYSNSQLRLQPPRISQTSSSSLSPNPGSAPSRDTPPSRETPPQNSLMRRSYHPNPPSQRSEFVMWVGNVPSDATHDEVWRFFESPAPTGVISIFLIARSSCAFVNFATEADLQRAISTYNKVPLRPTDPRCPMLVCRVRKKDDDLTAGVGGQRGTGMHTRWVRTQKAKEQEIEQVLGGLSIVDEHEVRPSSKPHPGSSSSDSFSSTNSSMLSQYFPKRYFILKSLTHEDLDRSVQTGLWTTQRHNEGILDQAYRSSKDGVYLIFSVNKSGEFYGYARMAGPIGEEHEPPPTAPSPPMTGQTRAPSSPGSRARDVYFPNPLVKESPVPLQTLEQLRTAITEGAVQYKPNLKSTPPELGEPHHRITPVTLAAKFSLDTRTNDERPPLHSQHPTTDTFHSPYDPNFKLEEAPPLRAIRSPTRDFLQMVSEDSEDHEPLGRPFRVEWLCTERLPFHLTRHLRNEWNKDREVKVSRDGTEIEPTVGERWIKEWKQMLVDAKEKTLMGGTRAREGRGRKAGKERVKEGRVPLSFR